MKVVVAPFRCRGHDTRTVYLIRIRRVRTVVLTVQVRVILTRVGIRFVRTGILSILGIERPSKFDRVTFFLILMLGRGILTRRPSESAPCWSVTCGPRFPTPRAIFLLRIIPVADQTVNCLYAAIFYCAHTYLCNHPNMYATRIITDNVCLV